MFSKNKEGTFKEAMKGLIYKTTVWGKNTSLGEFNFEKDCIVPSHKHPHEQTGYLISGKINMTIHGKKYLVEPGDSWNIPGNIEHSVEVLVDSKIVEVFSPRRDEYLPDK